MANNGISKTIATVPANAIIEGTLRLLEEEVVEFVEAVVELEEAVVEFALAKAGHTKLLSASVPEDLYSTNDTLVPAVFSVIQDWK